MNKFFTGILVVLLMCAELNIFAQNTDLIITYTENNAIEIPEFARARGGDFPTEIDSKKSLHVRNGESYYTAIPEEEKGDELEGDRRRNRWIRRMTDNSSIYQNLNTSEQYELLNAFDREFVIADTLHNTAWKIIASEQRDILGYTCLKAEYSDTTASYEAWFTPQIPLTFGPAGYGGLPGLILALAKGEQKVILATEVNLQPETVIIEKPSIKKVYSRSEFEALREEKIKEMRAMWSGRRR